MRKKRFDVPINPLTGNVADKTKYYINKEELAAEIIKTQEQQQCTDKLANMMTEIGRRVINFPRYANMTAQDKEDALSFCYYRLLKRGIFTVKADGNPFSYLTKSFELNILRWLQIKQQKQHAADQFIVDKIMEYQRTFGRMPRLMQQELDRIEGRKTTREDGYEEKENDEE